MAGPTGLEPATSGVTGQRSNQLNYGPETYASANFDHHSGVFLFNQAHPRSEIEKDL